jgi:hypothetical protein
MTAEPLIARLMSDYQLLWLEHFPGRFRRAEWHIIHHVCTRGRSGTSVGEIYGLARQIFLLDDATVRERVLSLAEAGLFEFDGNEAHVSARTILVPSEALLETFDRHLEIFGNRLLATARQIDPSIPAGDPPPGAAAREALRFLEAQDGHWKTAMEQFFDARGLSQARRLEARRQVLSTSHAALIRMALEHHYTAGSSSDGILADRMAGHLLQLMEQNFQTTRDHIAYLLALGVLERRHGKALHVALAPQAAQPMHAALGAIAASLRASARAMLEGAPGPRPVAASPAAEETVSILPRARTDVGPGSEHTLVIDLPAEARRRIPLAAFPISIGRAPQCEVVLDDRNISRMHCRLDLSHGLVTVTDLGSMNGTFLNGARISGTARLDPGSSLKIGPYTLEYGHVAQAGAPDMETVREAPKRGSVPSVTRRTKREIR